MTKHVYPRSVPGPLDYERFSTNGQIPNGAHVMRIADGLNHAANNQKKLLAVMVRPPDQAQAFNGPEKGSGRFHTGPTTARLRVRIGFLKCDKTGVGINPAVWLTLNGAAQTAMYYSDVENAASVIAPSETHHGQMYVSVSPDTTYYWTIDGQDEARIFYLTIAEDSLGKADDAVAGSVNPTPFIVGAPILRPHIQDLVDSANVLLRRGGAHLLQDNTMGSPSTSSATYSAITLDESVYMTLDTLYKDTRNRDVDVIWAVDGVLDVAGTGGCKLIDIAATDMAEITSFTASRAWHTLQTTIPATSDQQVKVQFKGDGTNTLTVYGWSLFMYDA